MSKNSKELLRLQLDDLIRMYPAPERVRPPRGGWARAVREALGMSQAQVAARLQVKQQSVQEIERAEASQHIRLDTLARIARAMGCRLVYAVVPEHGSIDDMCARQAKTVAEKMLKSVGHSMRLEGQGLSPREEQRQLKLLVDSLLHGDPRKLWQ